MAYSKSEKHPDKATNSFEEEDSIVRNFADQIIQMAGTYEDIWTTDKQIDILDRAFRLVYPSMDEAARQLFIRSSDVRDFIFREFDCEIAEDESRQMALDAEGYASEIMRRSDHSSIIWNFEELLTAAWECLGFSERIKVISNPEMTELLSAGAAREVRPTLVDVVQKSPALREVISKLVDKWDWRDVA